MNTGSESGPIVRVSRLVKRYGGKPVVSGVSFEVAEGEVFGLLGPNGAGKTTTMEMIEGLRLPDEGEIFVDGIDAIRHRDRVKRIIGVQLQSTALFEHLTVRESLQLRSEEHTSELQSRENLVCRLLLEKKNKP